MTAARPAPGLLELRDPPPGLPDPNSCRRRSPNPVTRSQQPGSSRCSPESSAAGRVRIADIVDRLNATYLDWIFSAAVVADVVLQLQVNWMADYRNSSGIVDRGWRVRSDGRDRGRVQGRPVDHPSGGARGDRLP